jgi:hypothetical protein
MSPRIGDDDELRVLHVWADPGSLSETAIDQQVALQISAFERLRGIRYMHQPACSREQLLQRLNASRPHVLQISAHGDREGRILLAHPDAAEPSALSKQELATLLHGRPELRLLILDCCYGLVNVAALDGAIEAVIGARERVREPYPIAFALSLYDSIASGRTLHAAVADAVVAAAERHAGDAASCFELWTASNVDPRQVVLRLVGSPAHESVSWSFLGLAVATIAIVSPTGNMASEPPSLRLEVTVQRSVQDADGYVLSIRAGDTETQRPPAFITWERGVATRELRFALDER